MCVLGDKHGEAVAESANDERLGADLARAALDTELLALLDRERDVELDARAGGLLSAAVALVDDLERLLDETLGLEARVQRLARHGGGELSVHEHVRVPADRRREVRVDRRGEPVVSERVARDRARAEVLGREHAARRHDAHERVECGQVRVLGKESV